MKGKKTWLAWALSVGLIAYLIGAATAGRSTVTDGEVVKAYASGTALHLDALQAGLEGPRAVDVEAAFSAVNVDSEGFPEESRLTENSITVQPDLTDPEADPPDAWGDYPGKNASARGSGLELGLGSDVPSEARSPIADTMSRATAPPDYQESNDAGPVPGAPIVYASLLHSDALAQWENSTCLTTPESPIAYGRGYAADVELVDTGEANEDGSMGAPLVATNDPTPERNVVQTESFVYALPNGEDDHYGLVAEIRQTYAPIQIAQDPATGGGAIEIEVLGEWFARAKVSGLSGGAVLEYGVTDPETGNPIPPSDPVIRINGEGFSLEDIGGAEGLEIPLGPLGTVMLGENFRAISEPGGLADPASTPTLEGDGTVASGAKDVVRVDLLDDPVTGMSLADLRIGHFEFDLEVPAGGFTCPAAATTTTTAPTTTTTTTEPPSTTTTLEPTTTTSPAPPTTTAPAPPPPAPPAVPIRMQPRTVG